MPFVVVTDTTRGNGRAAAIALACQRAEVVVVGRELLAPAVGLVDGSPCASR